MPRPAVLAAILALMLAMPALSQPAAAGAPGPVCRVPTVVDEMARQIRAGDYYAHVDPRLVTETPTPRPDRVLCQVCVLDTPYDTPRFGQKPVPRCNERNFEIHILPGGFIVRALS